MKNQSKFYLALALVLLATVACKKKKEDSDSSSSPVKELGQLKISDALALNVADGVTNAASGDSSSLRLTNSIRSQEACMLGQTIQDSFDSIKQIGEMICHFEIEKMEPGKKYKIALTGGGDEGGELAEQEYRIWLDDTKANKNIYRVHMCLEDTLEQVFEVEVNPDEDGRVRGSIANAGAHGTQSYTENVTFDRGFTVADIKRLITKQKHADSANGGEFKRSAEMVETAQDGGGALYELSLASSGTWGGSDFSEVGMARYLENSDESGFGQTVLTSSGTHEGNTYTFTRRAYFDEEGLVGSASDSDEHASGGLVYVKNPDDIPDFLESSFAPVAAEDFIEGAWDCDLGSDFVELDVDAATSAHKECEEKSGRSNNEERPSCWDNTLYQSGSAE